MYGAPNERMKTKTFREIKLKNDFIELTILPEAGCHWPRLRIPAPMRRSSALNAKEAFAGNVPPGPWIDLLYPAEDYAAILSAPSSTGSYIMAPWANRLPGGLLEFEGKSYPLRLNFPDHTAIHGDVRKRAWKVLEATPARFQAELDSAGIPDFNYPFHLLFDHAVELRDRTLFLDFTIQNKGASRAPAGFGYHPFFKRQLLPGRKDPILLMPAGKIFPAREHMPTGPAVAVGGKTDFRKEKPLGAPELDDCFTDFSEGNIRLIYPEDKVEVIFELDPVFSHAVIYIPSKAGGEGHDFFAVEPQTHVTGAIPLAAKGWKDTGLKVLEPGERWGGRLSLTVLSQKSNVESRKSKDYKK